MERLSGGYTRREHDEHIVNGMNRGEFLPIEEMTDRELLVEAVQGLRNLGKLVSALQSNPMVAQYASMMGIGK